MKKVALIILDGFGLAPPWGGNAIFLAKTEYLNKIFRNYTCPRLQASGEAVGLPFGEPGNSEAGHLNLGAGKVVHQDVQHIFNLIENGEFQKNKVLQEAMERTKKLHSSLHILGLLSDRGIHSHIRQLFALLSLCQKQKVKEVFLHLFTDGRDTGPQDALRFIEKLKRQINKLKVGKIASISGRFYAMDRDKHWERTMLVYNLLTKGEGLKFAKAEAAVTSAYQQGLTDEYIPPSLIEPVTVEENDSMIFFNVRGDRMRQLVSLFAESKISNLFIATFSFYGEMIKNTHSAFGSEKVIFPLARVIAENGFSQLHIAESEKYAHITYFFNGGREDVFQQEKRILIPSKRIRSYAFYPQMSAFEITSRIIAELKIKLVDFLLVNYANADMVGHTGNIKAAIQAIETLDLELKRLVPVLSNYYEIVITADHGNAEQMVNPKTGEVDPEHTTNPVPFIIISRDRQYPLREAGILADVAPTILQIMGLKKPEEMTGRSLIK